MDYVAAALAGAGVVGLALAVFAAGLAVGLSRTEERLKRIEGVLLTVSKHTRADEPVLSALDSQRDFGLVMLGLGDLIDYAARISPAAVKRLMQDKAPQLFEDRIG